MRAGSRQMIGVGKGMIAIGDAITAPAATAAGIATLAGQPEIAAPLAGVAFMGGLLSAGGRAELAGGRIIRNVGVKGEPLADQKKHVDELFDSAKKGSDEFQKKY